MRKIALILAIAIGSHCVCSERTLVFLQPNTTQLFTELYQAYSLLKPQEKTFFEDALYLGQSTPSTTPMQYSNQAIFDHGSGVLSELHRRVKDLFFS